MHQPATMTREGARSVRGSGTALDQIARAMGAEFDTVRVTAATVAGDRVTLVAPADAAGKIARRLGLAAGDVTPDLHLTWAGVVAELSVRVVGVPAAADVDRLWADLAALPVDVTATGTYRNIRTRCTQAVEDREQDPEGTGRRFADFYLRALQDEGLLDDRDIAAADRAFADVFGVSR